VCTLGGVATLGSDGTDSSTRVYDVRYMWAPVTTSYLVAIGATTFRGSGAGSAYLVVEAPRWGD
jgi:hypothetical protein